MALSRNKAINILRKLELRQAVKYLLAEWSTNLTAV